MSKIKDYFSQKITKKHLKIIKILTILSLIFLPLIVVNATTNYDNYTPQNYTIDDEGEIVLPKYCDEYDAEVPWHVVSSVFTIGSLFSQLLAVYLYKNNLKEQKDTMKSWVGGVVDRFFDDFLLEIPIIKKTRTEVFTTDRFRIIYILTKLNEWYKNFMKQGKNRRRAYFLIKNLFFSEMLIEFLSELLDMTYIGLVQNFLYQLGDGENLEAARYVIRGLWFYSLFHLSVISECLIFLMSCTSEDMDYFYRKYRYLLFGPLPILNMIEYIYVERMGEADNIGDNPIILLNNIISILFAIDVFRRCIDMMIISCDDYKLTLKEILPTLTGCILIASYCLRVYVNQQVQDLGALNDKYMEDNWANFTGSKMERHINTLYEEGYIDNLALKLQADVENYLNIYEKDRPGLACPNGYCYLLPEFDPVFGAPTFASPQLAGDNYTQSIMGQSVFFSVYKPWNDMPLKDGDQIGSVANIRPYERYHYLMEQFLENLENFLPHVDNCAALVDAGILEADDIAQHV